MKAGLQEDRAGDGYRGGAGRGVGDSGEAGRRGYLFKTVKLM